MMIEITALLLYNYIMEKEMKSATEEAQGQTGGGLFRPAHGAGDP